MIFKLLIFFAAIFSVEAVQAQLGKGSILGVSTIGVKNPMAQSSLPRCSQASLCATTDFIFTGNGLWTDAANWRDNVVPPTTLPVGKSITINPVSGGECRLNIRQTIADGATLIILPNKRLNVGNNLVFLKN